MNNKICCNTSVGCIIKNENEEFLFIKRTKGELGFAPVAGHAFDEHAGWDEAMIAELSEEVGIENLKKDVFYFSGLKTHAQLLEASRLLLKPDNTIKPFKDFYQDVKK